jgi:hypothetical protein
MTPRQQIRGLRVALKHLDQKIDQRKAELANQPPAPDDEEIIMLCEMRKQFQADLDQILKDHPELAKDALP